MRNVLLWGGLALVLFVGNYAIVGKERVLRDGEVMLFELAPRDPRSLLQGDFMALDYRLGGDIANAVGENSVDGRAVVRLDDRQVASFVRLHGRATPIAEGEHLVRFRKRRARVRIGGDAFFFQEGQAWAFSSARYGEVRVSDAGEVVLTGLRDREHRVLPQAPVETASPE